MASLARISLGVTFSYQQQSTMYLRMTKAPFLAHSQLPTVCLSCKQYVCCIARIGKASTNQQIKCQGFNTDSNRNYLNAQSFSAPSARCCAQVVTNIMAAGMRDYVGGWSMCQRLNWVMGAAKPDPSSTKMLTGKVTAKGWHACNAMELWSCSTRGGKYGKTCVVASLADAGNRCILVNSIH